MKARRAANRAVVTRLINEVSPLFKEEFTDHIRIRFNTISTQLAEKMTLLKTYNQGILDSIEVTDIEADVLESESIKDRIVQIRGEIEAHLSRTAVAHVTLPALTINSPPKTNTEGASLPVSSPSEAEHSSSSVKSPSVERVAGAKPKLPKLHLPKFSGDITKFKSFWDSFDSAIHKNPDLSLIDKFNYLRALLDGPAATTIQGLSLSEANYTAAVEFIQERFDKTKQIIAAHVDELIHTPACSGDKAAQVCALYNKINVHVTDCKSYIKGYVCRTLKNCCK